MYLPQMFAETRAEVLHGLIRAHPLASLVTMTRAGLVANPIPLLFDDSVAPSGALIGHVARANPIWREFDPSVEALAIFSGPQIYVSPSHYPSKREHGKVVPTWNYATVHVGGPLTVRDDPVWLRALLTRLTASQEDSRAAPWKLTDAPEPYVEAMLKAIVGIEIPVRRIEGKWKVSQNRLPADQAGVVSGLRTEGTPNALAMADLVDAARHPAAKPRP